MNGGVVSISSVGKRRGPRKMFSEETVLRRDPKAAYVVLLGSLYCFLSRLTSSDMNKSALRVAQPLV